MIAILKTLPARFARGELERFLGLDGKPCFNTYFFTLGRGKPSKADKLTKFADCPAWLGIDQLHFTHRGRLIGHFDISCVIQNVGQIPPLTTLDGDPSAWQIKPDRWVAVCDPPFHRLADKTIYHEAFRGWRYFYFESHRSSMSAKVRL